MAVAGVPAGVLRLTSNQFGVFSLIVCDEGSCTTGIQVGMGGSDESEFTKIHSNDVVRADNAST